MEDCVMLNDKAIFLLSGEVNNNDHKKSYILLITVFPCYFMVYLLQIHYIAASTSHIF